MSRESSIDPADSTTAARGNSSAQPTNPSRRTMDQTVLDEVIRRVVEVAKPDRIILFGSAVRQEMGPDSDLDLLVIKSGVQHRGRLEGDIYINLFGVGIPVDVVVVTPEDVARLGGSAGSVVRLALREGREVYVA